MIQIDDLIWSFLGMLIAVPILFLYLVGVRNRVAKKEKCKSKTIKGKFS